MSIIRPVLICAGAAVGTLWPSVRCQEVVVRHSLTVQGIEEVPKTYDIDAIGLTTEVILVDDGTPVLRKTPGRARAEGMTFFLPEIDDEVLVWFSWWKRIADTGDPEPHDADVVGFNADGDPVARWHFTNAWPNKFVLPGTAGEADADGVARATPIAITLQADTIDLLSPDGVAPLPSITNLAVNRRAGTFTMTWRSAAGASYKIFGWDEAAGKFVETAEVPSEGDETSFTRALVPKGLFYVLTASAPPQP